ncbi:hypothetical protein ABEW32_01405 [Paenibacillus jamilae]
MLVTGLRGYERAAAFEAQTKQMEKNGRLEEDKNCLLTLFRLMREIRT